MGIALGVILFLLSWFNFYNAFTYWNDNPTLAMFCLAAGIFSAIVAGQSMVS